MRNEAPRFAAQTLGPGRSLPIPAASPRPLTKGAWFRRALLQLAAASPHVPELYPGTPKFAVRTWGAAAPPIPAASPPPTQGGLASWGSFAGHALWQLAAYGGKFLMGRRACRQWTLDRSRLRAIIVQTLDLLLQRNNRESAAPQHRSAGLDRDCLTRCENKQNLKI